MLIDYKLPSPDTLHLYILKLLAHAPTAWLQEINKHPTGCEAELAWKCCTETCNLACTNLLMNLVIYRKLGQSDLLYGSKSPSNKLHEQAFSSQLSLTAL